MGRIWRGFWGGLRAGLDVFLGVTEGVYKSFKTVEVGQKAAKEGKNPQQAVQEYKLNYKPITVGYRGWNDAKYRGNMYGFFAGALTSLFLGWPFLLAAGIKSAYNYTQKTKGMPIGSYDYLGQAEDFAERGFYHRPVYQNAPTPAPITPISPQPQPAPSGLESEVEDLAESGLGLEGTLNENQLSLDDFDEDEDNLDVNEGIYDIDDFSMYGFGEGQTTWKDWGTGAYVPA